jgi:hypothetical protein
MSEHLNEHVNKHANELEITLPHLRSLIGLHVRHQGSVCVVLEILESPPALVLEPISAPHDATASQHNVGQIMANLHGQPGEFAVETRVVQILTLDRTGLHDELLELDLIG